MGKMKITGKAADAIREAFSDVPLEPWETEVRTCPICGGKFIPEWEYQIECSMECYVVHSGEDDLT